MSTLRALGVAASLIAAAQMASAKDAFDAAKCGGDVANVLIGQTIGNEPVAAIEKRHAAIGLKDEGSDEISDVVSFQSWTICGGSYHLLEKGGVVHDAVRADHSKDRPSFLGTCKVGGVEQGSLVFAILEGGTGGWRNVKSAWRIDEAAAKFVPIATASLTCPASGISTVDGGR